MDGTFVVKMFVWVFLTLAVGIPIYLYATKSRKKHRTSSARSSRRLAAAMIAFTTVLAAFLMIGAMAL